jgi:transcriptional regulator with XRE-family HTH domain
MAQTMTLEQRRLKKGVSYREIGKVLDMPQQTVWTHHSGKRIPKALTVFAYAKYYDCTPEAILKSFTIKGGKA